jgi:hypothetical protein
MVASPNGFPRDVIASTLVKVTSNNEEQTPDAPCTAPLSRERVPLMPPALSAAYLP